MSNRLLPVLALLGLGCLPIACKTTEGHDRAASTAEQVVAVGSGAGQTQLRLDNTLNALEQVAAAKDQDPKAPFDAFVKELGAFGDEFADLTRERERLKARAETWFAEFEAQNAKIQDAELRAAGTKRLGEFREQVADLSKQVDELMSGTQALQGRLGDLRTYLGNDLTPDSIGSVAGRISDAAKEGRKLAAGLGKLSKSSEAVAVRMRAAQKPPEAAR